MILQEEITFCAIVSPRSVKNVSEFVNFRLDGVGTQHKHNVIVLNNKHNFYPQQGAAYASRGP